MLGGNLIMTMMTFARASFVPRLLLMLLATVSAWAASDAPEIEYGPFISATFDNQWPKGAHTYKGVAVHLGAVVRESAKDPEKDIQLHLPEGGVIFDTELLRPSEAWNGGFLILQGIAFDMSHGVNPEVRGIHRIGTRGTPGWAKAGDFTDPRPVPYGPLPADWAKYKGLYRNGNKTIFAYRVGKCDVLESWALEDGIFYREFTVGPSTVANEVLLCETETVTAANMFPAAPCAELVENGTATAARLIAGPKGAELNFTKGSAISLKLPPIEKSASFKIAFWNGPVKEFDKFSEMPLAQTATDLNQFTQGGAPLWPQAIVGAGKLGLPANALPYVVDTLPIVEAPQMRTTGFDFFSDGRAAVCTLNGDVWIVSGIDDDLKKVSWRRFASGLFQPLGLKIVADVVYVIGRDQITRLHDLADSGEADFYENFNNDTQVTENFHEFAMDLQTDAAGNFYFTKAGPVVKGGNGFEKVLEHHGCVLRVSKDGSKLEVVATGLRAANGMSVGPKDEITTADNEGTWVPSSRINFIVPGGFYGCPPLAHVTPEPRTMEPPFCWIPHKTKEGFVDNSSGGQVWVTSNKWGPLEGSLLHFSYGTSSIFLVLRDAAKSTLQGGVVRIPLQFRSGIMRARFNPKDGNLYVCGMRGWQTTGLKWGCFQRVRYTGGPLYLPTGFSVKPNTILLTFASPLDEKSIDVDDISVTAWNYKWSSAYGSAHYKPSQPGKEGEDDLKVKSAQFACGQTNPGHRNPGFEAGDASAD